MKLELLWKAMKFGYGISVNLLRKAVKCKFTSFPGSMLTIADETEISVVVLFSPQLHTNCAVGMEPFNCLIPDSRTSELKPRCKTRTP